MLHLRCLELKSNEYYHLNYCKSVGGYIWSNGVDRLYDMEDIKIQRCTEKLDIRKKLIYEGDTVCITPYDTNRLIGTVVWDDVHCQFLIVTSKDALIPDASFIFSEAPLEVC